MVEITLKLDPGRDEIDPIHRGLIEFNRESIGRPAGWQPFALNLVDDNGEKIGGLEGWTTHDWLFIGAFFVPTSLRGTGLGRQLMARAEAFARERDCVGIWLDTFAFQAPGFYEKLGFTQFASIDDHPRGSRRMFYLRRLEPSSNH